MVGKKKKTYSNLERENAGTVTSEYVGRMLGFYMGKNQRSPKRLLSTAASGNDKLSRKKSAVLEALSDGCSLAVTAGVSPKTFYVLFVIVPADQVTSKDLDCSLEYDWKLLISHPNRCSRQLGQQIARVVTPDGVECYVLGFLPVVSAELPPRHKPTSKESEHKVADEICSQLSGMIGGLIQKELASYKKDLLNEVRGIKSELSWLVEKDYNKVEKRMEARVDRQLGEFQKLSRGLVEIQDSIESSVDACVKSLDDTSQAMLAGHKILLFPERD